MQSNNMEKVMLKDNHYILKSGDNNLDFSSVKTKDFYISNEVNENSQLFLSNLNAIETLKIDINEGSHVVLSVLLEKDFKELNIEINVKNSGFLEGFFAEFAEKSLILNCNINLLEEGASAYVKLASLCSKTDDKKINISINHKSPKTYGKVDNYGVCKDSGQLLFAGTSHILEKSVQSKTEQNAKIMVFDESSKAIAKPILKIDENDIEASHAAVVGKINDEHLFYLIEGRM